MSEKDLPRVLRVSFNISLVFLICCLLKNQLTLGNHIPSVYIASKDVFSTVCIDSDGNTRSHEELWTDSSGSCDQRICFSKSNEIFAYELKYDCNIQEDIFDPDNCQLTSDSALTFPDCCPQLHCSNGTLPNTTTTACYDRSSSVSCIIWQATFNCSGYEDYCRKTCGICS